MAFTPSELPALIGESRAFLAVLDEVSRAQKLGLPDGNSGDVRGTLGIWSYERVELSTEVTAGARWDAKCSSSSSGAVIVWPACFSAHSRSQS